jgi:thioredoxin 1
MAFVPAYSSDEPARDQVDAMSGPVVLEFGAPWCGHCIAAQPLVEAALSAHPQVRHIRIEDGRGRPLGRSYRVKLWPTLVFLRDGRELAREVRPRSAHAITDALARIDGAAAPTGPDTHG